MLKINVLLAAALTALGGSLASAGAVSEKLCDNYNVSAFEVAQVTESGGCIVFVSIATGAAGAVERRPVANAQGNVRVFKDLASVAQLVKRAKRTVGCTFDYLPSAPTAAAGDPIERLKRAYRGAKKDRDDATDLITAIEALQTAAVANGDDTATGTPAYDEYVQYGVRLVVVNGVKTWALAEVTAKATALTNAGVDPNTVI